MATVLLAIFMNETAAMLLSCKQNSCHAPQLAIFFKSRTKLRARVSVALRLGGIVAQYCS